MISQPHASAPRARGRRLLAAPLAALVVLAALLAALAPGALAAPRPAAGGPLRLGTYYGGSSDDMVYGVAVDATGIYLTGRTYSSDLPGVGGPLASSNDLFV